MAFETTQKNEKKKMNKMIQFFFFEITNTKKEISVKAEKITSYKMSKRAQSYHSNDYYLFPFVD